MFLLWVCRACRSPGHSLANGLSCTAVSLDEDVDTDKELVGHGMSNLAAGLLGTVCVLTYRALWWDTDVSKVLII